MDVFEVVYLSAGRAGGRMPLLLEEDARHFSQTGSELLRDSLISSDFRVSSGNYRRTAWVANTHIRKYVHIGRSRSGPPTYTTSAAIWNPCVGGKYIDPECIIHPTEVNI